MNAIDQEPRLVTDANGKPITVGCFVKSLHPAADPKATALTCPPEQYHYFFNKSEVTRIMPLSGHVVVKSTMKRHIPVHLPQNLVVVNG